MSKKVTSLFMLMCILLITLTASVAWAASKGSVTIVMTTFGKEGRWWPQGILAEKFIIGAMSDPLVTQYSPFSRVKPAVASSWKISEDGLSIDFTIREDVYFHDGTKLTPEDVSYTIAPEWIDQFDGFSRIKGGNVKSTEIKGNHFIVHLGKPVPQILNNYMVRIGIRPKAYIEKVGVKGYNKKPIGAGPFKFVKHVKGEYVKMEAVEDHYRKVPDIKELTWRLVPEPATHIALLRTGEADISYGANVRELNKYNFRTKNFGAPLQGGLFFGRLSNKEPSKSRFEDIRVRRAMLYAIDKEKLSKLGYYGAARPAAATFMISSLIPGYNDAYKPFPYDPEKAKALLAEAGYPDGFTSNFYFSTTDKQMALLVGSDLEKVGIKTNLKAYENTTLTKMRYGRKWTDDSMFYGAIWAAGIGALFYFDQNAMLNAYSSQETHDLHNEGGAIIDIGKQIKWIHDVLSPKMYDLQPVLPLIERSEGTLGLGPRIKSWEKTDNHTFGLEFITLKD